MSTAGFHIWRTKLAAASGYAADPVQPAAFIELGAVAALMFFLDGAVRVFL